MDRILITLVVLLHTQSASAEIYKWVDAEGKSHYGDKPVVHAQQLDIDITKKGHINTGESREEKRQKLLDAMSEDRARDNEEKEKKRVRQKKTERQCAWATDRLKRYERASYLYDLDKDGNRIAIPSEERDKRTEDLRKKISRYCR